MKERLNPKTFGLDARIKDGYYSDKYFCRTKTVLEVDNHYPQVLMQVFQRQDNVCLCGMDEAIAIIKDALGNKFKDLEVKALHDGDITNAWETVMTIEGKYPLFAHLETAYLGALARGTLVATNVYRCFKAANGKPIFFFPGRFDSHLIQAKDGYSYMVGRKAAGFENAGGVSTDAQGEWWGSEGMGTIPHGLIAAYMGDTTEATLKFAEIMPPEIKRVTLVDWDNDCVATTVRVAIAMKTKFEETGYDDRFKLYGVRLDTSGSMVDKSIVEDMEKNEYVGDFKPTGVNARLVRNVRAKLDKMGGIFNFGIYFLNIKIFVSGGFNAEKISAFEKDKVPVDAYGVGSSLFKGNFDFTADIVKIKAHDKWIHCAKKGRKYNENPKLEIVEEQPTIILPVAQEVKKRWRGVFE